ncbi:hypothetical protein VL23_08755 [Stenotrophomonas maltophilia]|uniref:Transmembrane protein n=1 Tax=Stenotrophomonas maltophilia TaxID=40324 RepID=A0AB34TJL8_STEMA|nr:hypothetical protein VL23_08755 [Stenotrophomonas maltophilia]
MNWLKLLRLYFPALLAAFLSLICALIVSSLSGNSMIRGFRAGSGEQDRGDDRLPHMRYNQPRH